VTTSGFPTRLVDVIAGFHLDTWLLLMVINVVLLFVGPCSSRRRAILILTPLLIPLITEAGVDRFISASSSP